MPPLHLLSARQDWFENKRGELDGLIMIHDWQRSRRLFASSQPGFDINTPALARRLQWPASASLHSRLLVSAPPHKFAAQMARLTRSHHSFLRSRHRPSLLALRMASSLLRAPLIRSTPLSRFCMCVRSYASLRRRASAVLRRRGDTSNAIAPDAGLRVTVRDGVRVRYIDEQGDPHPRVSRAWWSREGGPSSSLTRGRRGLAGHCIRQGSTQCVPPSLAPADCELSYSACIYDSCPMLLPVRVAPHCRSRSGSRPGASRTRWS